MTSWGGRVVGWWGWWGAPNVRALLLHRRLTHAALTVDTLVVHGRVEVSGIDGVVGWWGGGVARWRGGEVARWHGGAVVLVLLLLLLALEK